MSILLGVLSVLIVIGLAYALSNDRKNINFIGIGVMLLAQLITTWFMFMTPIGEIIIQSISSMFNKLMEFGQTGVAFILGGLVIEEGASVFFFNVLLLIIIFATLLSIFTYLRILSLLIKYIVLCLSKITGV